LKNIVVVKNLDSWDSLRSPFLSTPKVLSSLNHKDTIESSFDQRLKEKHNECIRKIKNDKKIITELRTKEISKNISCISNKQEEDLYNPLKLDLSKISSVNNE